MISRSNLIGEKNNPWPKRAVAQSIALPERRILISELIGNTGDYLDQTSRNTIYDAYLFSAKAHQGQTRSSGEAYIFHPIAVARILIDWHMDSRTIVAAILHDVIEDTAVSCEQIRQQFGADVAHLVDGVSKISQLEESSKEKAEARSFRKMFMATAEDIRVILIKLADRLHNMRTLESLPATKRQRIASQTLDLYAPIANRLGMRELTQQLEDLSFKTLYPKRYNAILDTIKRSKRGKKSVINQICHDIQKQLDHANVKGKVYGREKNVFSIYRKMRRKHLSFKEVQDVYAVRVVVDDVKNCYLVLGLIHGLYKPRPSGFKDYIAIPKTNGYQSLHTIIFGPSAQPVEIQIRSREMHRISETGVASHWRYKTDSHGKITPQQLAQKWMDGFIKSQDQVGDSGEFMEYLKVDLFPDEVYVFTPKGEIKRLPREATALDFAYCVHSDVGDHCVAARVNQQMVPLHDRLKNGDHIEIITSRNARPILQWLDYVVTSKARSSIKHYLHKQKKREALRLGKKLLKKTLAELGYKKLRIPSGDKVRLLTQLQLDDWSQLLTDIGLGNRLPKLVARQFLPHKSECSDAKHDHSALAIAGTERLLVTYASCCYPIPDDKIIGYLSSGRGLVVHRIDCPNYKELSKMPDKLLPISWADQIQTTFQVALRLDTQNRPGVLARLSRVVASQKSNIIDLSVSQKDSNHSSMYFLIEVKNRKHLAMIIRLLHADSAVIKLGRSCN